MDEFSLIQTYFNRPASSALIELGNGDDAAAFRCPQGQVLVQTMDSLNAGYHFPPETPAVDIAWKSLAVNVSDLAAMGAQPAFFLLSLSLPEADESFLKPFSSGLFQAADEFGIELIGGDTCRGPLSITIQASGFAAVDSLVRRAGAVVGDRIFVSGELGMAALGLAVFQSRETLPEQLGESALSVLNRPRPRLDLVGILSRFATSAIDISDGLVGDLGHILNRSGVGARLIQDKLPVRAWFRDNDAFDYALFGGDDYQLLFTVSAQEADEFCDYVLQQGLDVSEIGEITGNGFELLETENSATGRDLSRSGGFRHFGA